MKSIEILKKEFGQFELCRYEEQNKEYEGMILDVADLGVKVRSRLSKKTPKKSGYFVAFWEKNDYSKNKPFKDINSPEILAIVVCDSDKKGIFIIPKEGAISQHILSTKDQTGKMSMRFYPPWCLELNKTARQTQEWQLKYFKDFSQYNF